MFQKRRSMLGRRHLMSQQTQQVQARLAHPQAMGDGSGSSSSRGAKNSWRGRQSEKKKSHSHMDKSPKEFKKCLFSRSPGLNYMAGLRMQSQDRDHHSSNDNLLNDTGIMTLAPTPGSTPRINVTSATFQQHRAEIKKARYGPLPSTASLTTNTDCETNRQTSSSSSSFQPSYICDLNDLKPPDSPGPSRLERILLEEKLAQNSSSSDFYRLKRPVSPGPSRLEQLIREEKLEQPLDPDLIKMQNPSLEDPNPSVQFSPPLSSSCIGSPDSGKKNTLVKEEITEAPSRSGRKLSTIKEDCNVSLIEFELNERTICDLDNTLMDTTLSTTRKSDNTLMDTILSTTRKSDNTLMDTTLSTTRKLDNTLMDSTLSTTRKPNNVSSLNDLQVDQKSQSVEEFELTWKNMLSQLDKMDRVVIDNATSHENEIKALKEHINKKIENMSEKFKNESLEIINNIKLMKKTLESLKNTVPVVHSTEDKENDFTFRIPTCKKKQSVEVGKWFKSMKEENPGLLKTPNPNRMISRSSTLTPRSLTKVVHDQMSDLMQ